MKKMNKILISSVAALTIATNLVGATACDFGGKKNDNTPVNVVAYDGSKVDSCCLNISSKLVSS